MSLKIQCRIIAGDYLPRIAEEAIELRNKLNCDIEFKFNDIDISVYDHSTIESIEKSYNDGLEIDRVINEFLESRKLKNKIKKFFQELFHKRGER